MVELNEDDLKIFSTFEKITHVMPTDYVISSSSLVFLVSEETLGKAIGKQASNIEKLRKMFRKRVVIVADKETPEDFLKSFFGNVQILDIEARNVMGETALMMTVDEKDRGIAIGRDGERIKAAKSLLKKKFNATVHVKTRKSPV
ncbi:NusA-like transcription termination signal-binding factor [Candidatus Micrarchaeota archaeon]|nr:NusA-like transcription termination signal-binding factor [Candidatus Micrarchaeota archaeon]